MVTAAFGAKCPCEIGDKINAVKAADGKLYSLGVSTITDIACTYYLKRGKAVFTYGLDSCGQYAPVRDLRSREKEEGQN